MVRLTINELVDRMQHAAGLRETNTSISQQLRASVDEMSNHVLLSREEAWETMQTVQRTLLQPNSQRSLLQIPSLTKWLRLKKRVIWSVVVFGPLVHTVKSETSSSFRHSRSGGVVETRSQSKKKRESTAQEASEDSKHEELLVLDPDVIQKEQFTMEQTKEAIQVLAKTSVDQNLPLDLTSRKTMQQSLEQPWWRKALSALGSAISSIWNFIKRIIYGVGTAVKNMYQWCVQHRLFLATMLTRLVMAKRIMCTVLSEAMLIRVWVDPKQITFMTQLNSVWKTTKEFTSKFVQIAGETVMWTLLDQIRNHGWDQMAKLTDAIKSNSLLQSEMVTNLLSKAASVGTAWATGPVGTTAVAAYHVTKTVGSFALQSLADQSKSLLGTMKSLSDDPEAQQKSVMDQLGITKEMLDEVALIMRMLWDVNNLLREPCIHLRVTYTSDFNAVTHLIRPVGLHAPWLGATPMTGTIQTAAPTTVAAMPIQPLLSGGAAPIEIQTTSELKTQSSPPEAAGIVAAAIAAVGSDGSTDTAAVVSNVSSSPTQQPYAMVLPQQFSNALFSSIELIERRGGPGDNVRQLLRKLQPDMVPERIVLRLDQIDFPLPYALVQDKSGEIEQFLTLSRPTSFVIDDTVMSLFQAITTYFAMVLLSKDVDHIDRVSGLVHNYFAHFTNNRSKWLLTCSLYQRTQKLKQLKADAFTQEWSYLQKDLDDVDRQFKWVRELTKSEPIKQLVTLRKGWILPAFAGAALSSMATTAATAAVIGGALAPVAIGVAGVIGIVGGGSVATYMGQWLYGWWTASIHPWQVLMDIIRDDIHQARVQVYVGTESNMALSTALTHASLDTLKTITQRVETRLRAPYQQCYIQDQELLDVLKSRFALAAPGSEEANWLSRKANELSMWIDAAQRKQASGFFSGDYKEPCKLAPPDSLRVQADAALAHAKRLGCFLPDDVRTQKEVERFHNDPVYKPILSELKAFQPCKGTTQAPVVGTSSPNDIPDLYLTPIDTPAASSWPTMKPVVQSIVLRMETARAQAGWFGRPPNEQARQQAACSIRELRILQSLRLLIREGGLNEGDTKEARLWYDRWTAMLQPHETSAGKAYACSGNGAGM